MKSLYFAKRNFKELLRDPLMYIFGLAFPLVMLVLFMVINKYTYGGTPIFEYKSLISGIITFSYSFIMLLMSLLVSKDRTTAFVKRLFTSPMKATDFILGYGLTGLVLGLCQAIIAIFFGNVFVVVLNQDSVSFGNSCLLILSSLPLLLINVFAGILFGTVLSDKSAPGLASVFISASGVLSGAWMPLDTMGGFENFCRFLPFYPSNYIGRIITGGMHTPIKGESNPYMFDTIAKLGLVCLAVYLLLTVILCVVAFRRTMKKG